jgi:hypothetical protein
MLWKVCVFVCVCVCVCFIILVATFHKSFQSSFNLCVDECVSNQGTQQSTRKQKTESERGTHFTSLQCECECECEFHKSKQTQFEKIERERIQDVDWDLCSNTFSSIVQVSLDILEESLVSILHLCRCVCMFANQQSIINKERNERGKLN